MKRSYVQQVKQLKKIAGILKEDEDFDLSDNPLNITKRKDNKQERDEILNGVKYQFDINNAVQEFLGWSEERAKLATERDWDEVVDAIIDSPGLKSRFIDVDPELGHLVYEDDDFDLSFNPLDDVIQIGDALLCFDEVGESADEGTVVDKASNYDEAFKKDSNGLKGWRKRFDSRDFANSIGYDYDQFEEFQKQYVKEVKRKPWYKVKFWKDAFWFPERDVQRPED